MGSVKEPNKFHIYERPPIYASSCMVILGERTEQHVVIGLESWLQSITIRRHLFSILTEFN